MRIYVEANIGSGKTTFLNLLEEDYNTIKEPLDEWLKLTDGEENILDKFYKDADRWAYTFQMETFMSRIQSIKKNEIKGINIIERSIYTDMNCFASLAHYNGHIQELEWKLYNKWFNWLDNSFDVKADGYIYIRTDPQISYNRIAKRSRTEESSIPFKYLEQVHQKHQQWLNSTKTPVLILDGNQEFESNNVIINTWKENINEFIEKLNH